MTRRTTRGFTLLELVIVVSILAVLAGVAVPVALKSLERATRHATLEELDVLADASAEFFRDTWTLPGSVRALHEDPGLAGWTGPYVQTTGRDLRTGGNAVELDGWSFPYALTRSGPSVLELTSPGADGVVGHLDDHTVRVDVTRIRRAVTLERLATINQAITLYNADFHTSDPLPGSWPLVLSKLVARGFLPAAAPFENDGWDRPFVPDPPARLPVVRVASAALAR